MKYYYDDDDRTYVEKDGVIYYYSTKGIGNKSSYLRPDPMKWHECTEEEAIEEAKIYESYFK